MYISNRESLIMFNKTSSGVAGKVRTLQDAGNLVAEVKRNNFGVSSSGTDDYRHGAGVRPKVTKVVRGTGVEVSKKIGYVYDLEA